ncbi:MAG: hypothetical protein KatS3mg031_1252 [Chitinophagales bacterium]|nr:MAG: hypothetical protein KatS3mg031_1252 [Chitinophagales bacterium]
MIVSEITLFNTLKEKLGEKEAQIVVEGIKSAIKEEFDNKNKKGVLLTKGDKVEMMRWMFIFWIGTIGVLSGIMFAMLNAYLK